MRRVFLRALGALAVKPLTLLFSVFSVFSVVNDFDLAFPSMQHTNL